MNNAEEDRLYDYLIDNYPLDVNTHNAMLHAPKTSLTHTVEDIAIFVLKRQENKIHRMRTEIDKLRSERNEQ